MADLTGRRVQAGQALMKVERDDVLTEAGVSQEVRPAAALPAAVCDEAAGSRTCCAAAVALPPLALQPGSLRISAESSWLLRRYHLGTAQESQL